MAALHLNLSKLFFVWLVVNWKKPTPKLSPVLKSIVFGIPISSAAFWNSSSNFKLIFLLATVIGPLSLWNSLLPNSLFSDFRKYGRTSDQPQPVLPNCLQMS